MFAENSIVEKKVASLEKFLQRVEKLLITAMLAS